MSGLRKDDVIRMAQEAGYIGFQFTSITTLERFAKLIAAAEREAICALLGRLVDTYESMDRQGSAEDIRKLIQHIRARGNDAA